MLQKFIPVLGLLLAAAPGCLLAQSNEDCMDCHADAELVTTGADGGEVSLFVDLGTFEASIHGGFDCVDCHEDADLPHDDQLATVACDMCHEDSAEDFALSFHALGRRDGNPLSPGCADCHGTHDIEPSAVATAHTNPRNIVEMCGHCHSSRDVIDSSLRKGFDPVTDYEASVHGKILEADPEARVATCVSCHGHHAIVPPYNPKSTFGKIELPNTCGQCHEKESEEYKDSIHWQAVLRGYFESPVCNDCHSEHRIISPSDSEAMTHPSLVSSDLCASCHSNRTLMASFGLDADRLATYRKTYHGLAVLRGSPDAANCVSCHEMHAIKSSRDELSATHPDNLQVTCGQCHEGADATFARVGVHPSHQRERNPVAYFFKVFYLWLIPLTIGGMLVHNLIIQSYFIRRRHRMIRAQPQFRRFQRFEVPQHMLLVLSFFVLVVTGFALKFPDAGWVDLIGRLGLTEALRSTLHRVAGGVLVAVSAVQLCYFLFARRGRREVKELMPSKKDLRDMGQNMAFHLERRGEKPRYGRFDYTEKAEYLALIWGTAVMAATGFVLWFPQIFLAFLPVWIFEASEVIHYYEAWLATLAIVVWHWYFVIFHPGRYPLAFIWMSGTLPVDKQKEHHPLEEIDDESH